MTAETDTSGVPVGLGSGWTKYDLDPQALAWARAKIQREIDKARNWQKQKESAGEDASTWRRYANLLDMHFIGGEGCVIAAFDARRPEFAHMLAASRPVKAGD